MKKKAYAPRNGKVIPFARRKGYAYPNAAEQSIFLNRVLDWALAVASTLGTAAIMLFFMVLA